MRRRDGKNRAPKRDVKSKPVSSASSSLVGKSAVPPSAKYGKLPPAVPKSLPFTPKQVEHYLKFARNHPQCGKHPN
jgi:hypothetical protein